MTCNSTGETRLIFEAYGGWELDSTFMICSQLLEQVFESATTGNQSSRIIIQERCHCSCHFLLGADFGRRTCSQPECCLFIVFSRIRAWESLAIRVSYP